MIDLALAFYLIFVYPSAQLWRSLRQRDAPKRPRGQRYLSSIRTIGLALLALLATCWWSGHTARDLGLAIPASGSALWCLLISFIGLTALYFTSKAKVSPEKAADMRARANASDMMPGTRSELKLFLLTTLFIGAGWELLYRGFLTLVLTPFIGVWGAVLVGGLAYGMAHGYKSPGQLTASIVSALLFGTGYVATGSLWWLIAIHIGLPLLGAVSSYHILNQKTNGEPHAIS